MNSISAQNHASVPLRAFGPGQEVLGRSLQRFSSESRLGLPDTASPTAVAVSRRFDAQDKRVQSALGAVQHAASAVQTAAGFLGGIDGILGQMRTASAQLKNPDAAGADQAAAQEEFQALQEQLREALAAPAGRFQGKALFGSEDPAPPAEAADAAVALPKFRLQGTALSALVRQDPSGAFMLAGGEAKTGDVLKSALQDVKAARSSVTAAGLRLQLEAATLQIESENISSALTPIPDEAAGSDATRSASGSILLQPGAALRAHGNLGAFGVLKVLES